MKRMEGNSGVVTQAKGPRSRVGMLLRSSPRQRRIMALARRRGRAIKLKLLVLSMFSYSSNDSSNEQDDEDDGVSFDIDNSNMSYESVNSQQPADQSYSTPKNCPQTSFANSFFLYSSSSSSSSFLFL